MVIGVTSDLMTTIVNMLDDLLVGLGTSGSLNRLSIDITEGKKLGHL